MLATSAPNDVELDQGNHKGSLSNLGYHEFFVELGTRVLNVCNSTLFITTEEVYRN